MTPSPARPLVFCATCRTELERGRCVDDGRHKRTITVPTDIASMLAEVYRPDGMRIWLRGRHRLLDEQLPLDLIAAGRDDEVRAVIHGLIEGVFV